MMKSGIDDTNDRNQNTDEIQFLSSIQCCYNSKDQSEEQLQSTVNGFPGLLSMGMSQQ